MSELEKYQRYRTLKEAWWLIKDYSEVLQVQAKEHPDVLRYGYHEKWAAGVLHRLSEMMELEDVR